MLTFSAIGSLHDEWGNAPSLLSAEDAERLEVGAWSRADQNTPCHECGEPYWKHPEVIGARWLRRICGDYLVKL